MDLLLIILASVAVVLLITILVLVLVKIGNTGKIDTSEIKDLMREENSKISDNFSMKNSDLRANLVDVISKSNKESIIDLNQFKEGLNKQLGDSFRTLSKTLNDQMNGINDKVENRLTEGFKQTNQTFQNIVERLSKIDEAQKNIEKLSSEVVDLQHLLTDKKSRGTFGEVQLNHILESIFGENNEKIYKTQATLSNGKIVDAMLHIPDPMGDLPIDSKFPLENYRRMVDKDATEQERDAATRKFKTDLKKHVDDIASKYIILTETADQAVMFLPAEAIFAEINAYHQDLVEYAQRKRVWIASPTTLMSFLTTVQVLLRNLERDKHAKIIQEELIKLSQEFGRYKDRWDKLSRTIETVTKDVKNIHISTEKIGKRFEEIAAVDIEEIQEIE
jgi:DNA recombination protein RmuC